jgi:hypothetical protein
VWPRLGGRLGPGMRQPGVEPPAVPGSREIVEHEHQHDDAKLASRQIGVAEWRVGVVAVGVQPLTAIVRHVNAGAAAVVASPRPMSSTVHSSATAESDHNVSPKLLGWIEAPKPRWPTSGPSIN